MHPSELRIAAVLENEIHLGWPGETMLRVPLEGTRDAVEFSPDGAQVAVGGLDSTVWTLEAKSGAVQYTRGVEELDPFRMPSYFTRLRWSPDDRRLAVVAGKGLKPGILDPTDLSITWAGAHFGARGRQRPYAGRPVWGTAAPGGVVRSTRRP